MKKIDEILTRAALRRILLVVEKEQRRDLPADSPRILLNVLNSGVMIDLVKVKKIALTEAARNLRRVIK